MQTDSEALWSVWSTLVQQAGFPLVRLQNKPSQSDLSELLCGYWLQHSDFQIERSEILRERVQSPRRQRKQKTCDFLCRSIHAPERELYVEVKCSESPGDAWVRHCISEAVQKGARWLILFQLPIADELSGTLHSEDIQTDAQRNLLSPRGYLKIRRAGLTRITQLSFAPSA